MSIPPLPAHMHEPPVKAAQVAWEEHFQGCPTCQVAATFRDACEEGRRLHEEWVVAAHEAFKGTRP